MQVPEEVQRNSLAVKRPWMDMKMTSLTSYLISDMYVSPNQTSFSTESYIGIDDCKEAALLSVALADIKNWSLLRFYTRTSPHQLARCNAQALLVGIAGK